MEVPPLPRTPGGTRRFFDAYTQGLTTADLERVFTRDAPEAYRFFSRAIDFEELSKLPWHRRTLAHLRLFFLAFTLKLSPARRAIYGVALLATFLGLIELFQDVSLPPAAAPVFAPGTMWLVAGFLLVNLIVLLEVADRLSLKNDLEVARDIQQAMLPTAAYRSAGRRSIRHDAAREHRGRRLLRCHPAARRAGAAGARRRRRQGQPGRAADGAAAGDAPDAGRRRAGERGAR